MTLYMAILILFYLAGVMADYKTTKINLAAGKNEINPMLKKNTQWRLLVPFLCASPVLVFLIGVEYVHLENGEYVNQSASFVYVTKVFYAQIASLAVFFMLVVASSKVVASISNLFIIYCGRGLPDLVGYVIGWRSTRLIFMVTTLVSLIAVVPLVYGVRYISFSMIS